jgi:hypothetical protein
MDQKSNAGDDNNTSETTNSFHRIQETVKTKLYTVYYMILGGENIKNATVSIFFIIIELFQLLRFPFHTEVIKKVSLFFSLLPFSP